MGIAYVCDKKKKCKDSITCGGDGCNHTLSEEHALYPEHGRFVIFGDKGNGFTLEEIENDQSVNQHGSDAPEWKEKE